MSDALIEAIGALLDDAARSPLAGIIEYTRSGEASSIAFTSDGVTGEWDYKYQGKPRRMTRDERGTVTERSGSRVREVEERSNRVPFELRIAFPIALPVWDRLGDDWRMVSATKDGQVVIIDLAHRERPEFSATLTVDVERRLAVNFTTPLDSIALFPEIGPTQSGAYASYEMTAPQDDD